LCKLYRYVDIYYENKPYPQELKVSDWEGTIPWAYRENMRQQWQSNVRWFLKTVEPKHYFSECSNNKAIAFKNKLCYQMFQNFWDFNMKLLPGIEKCKLFCRKYHTKRQDRKQKRLGRRKKPWTHTHWIGQSGNKIKTY